MMKKFAFHKAAGFFLALILALGVTAGADAASGDKVRLPAQDSSQAITMVAENMFPGDRVEKLYEVTVSHSQPVLLHYRADIRAGYEKLAEVLKLKVELPEQSVLLYDGLMRDMPASVTHILPTGQNALTYKLTVYLDTSVGNEYQNQSLIADFRWWYMEEEAPPLPPTPPGPPVPDEPDPVSVKVSAEVLLDDDYPTGSDFTFILADEDGNAIQTVNNEDGLIQFDSLTFGEEGAYVYYMTQIPGDDPDITYDAAVYKVIVTVTLQDGAYVAVITYERDGVPYTALPRFINTTTEEPPPGPSEPVGPEGPQTGDNSHILSYLGVGSVCLMAAIILLFLGRRKEERNDEH